MRLEWDWLTSQVFVPFVPTIGPVHPEALGAGLFSDVINVAGTAGFLTHDKDRRWFDAKEEAVLVEAIVHGPHETLFPVLSRRGAGSVSVHLYGAHPESSDTARRLASRLCWLHGAATARVVWFAVAEVPWPTRTQVVRVHLQDLRWQPRPTEPDAVHLLSECPGSVKATFETFASALASSGFAFLRSRMAAGEVGPVLVAVEAGTIVGAIGPMEIMGDSQGNARLLPQYFGVLPNRRGQGHGRALWRAAMQWGHRNGAAYQIAQTQLGSASDHICTTEGLRSLGLVCRTTV